MQAQSILNARDEAFARFEATQPADAEFGDWLAGEDRALFEAVAEIEEGVHPATTAEIAELLAPFVGAKLNPKRDPNSLYGAYLPRTECVDVLGIGDMIDASVRSVGPDGVEVFFYKGCDLIAWPELRGIRIVSLDADGNRAGVTAYRHVGARRAAA